MQNPITLDSFFNGRPASHRIFEALLKAVEPLGPWQVRVSKSQIALRRKRNFAIVWMPEQYLGGGHAPLVLTMSFPTRDRSPRWKEIVEPAPRRFTHHLELYSESEIDDQVRRWLHRAYEAAK